MHITSLGPAGCLVCWFVSKYMEALYPNPACHVLALLEQVRSFVASLNLFPYL